MRRILYAWLAFSIIALALLSWVDIAHAQAGNSRITVPYASASIDFVSIAASTCTTQTVTAPGFAIGDTVACGFPSAINGNLAPSCFVTAANQVGWRLCNDTGAGIDPAQGTFTIRAVR